MVTLFQIKTSTLFSYSTFSWESVRLARPTELHSPSLLNRISRPARGQIPNKAAHKIFFDDCTAQIAVPSRLERVFGHLRRPESFSSHQNEVSTDEIRWGPGICLDKEKCWKHGRVWAAPGLWDCRRRVKQVDWFQLERVYLGLDQVWPSLP